MNLGYGVIPDLRKVVTLLSLSSLNALTRNA
jgi:hypothetical protein